MVLDREAGLHTDPLELLVQTAPLHTLHPATGGTRQVVMMNRRAYGIRMTPTDMQPMNNAKLSQHVDGAEHRRSSDARGSQLLRKRLRGDRSLAGHHCPQNLPS